jgi:hypothetical protein
MNKIIIILLSCFVLTGCSLIPRLNFNTSNNVPQSIDKSKVKEYCKGETKFDEEGNIIYCSKGYYNYLENYNKEERAYTLKEKILNFFRNLTGYFFWIALALVILCPSLLGFIVGRVIEGVFGIAKKTLSSTVKAIQKVRKDGKPLDDALAIEHDANMKKYIKELKDKENIK